MLWFSLLVLIPLADGRRDRRSGGAGRLLDTITNPQTLSAVELTVIAGAAGDAGQRRDGHGDRLGAGARPVLGQARSLDVVIDIPFALPTIVAGLVLLSLYGPQSPLGVDVANTRTAVFLALAVRDAAVRRAHRAAGARGARRRRRGGGRLARREPAHDLPADHPAEPGAGDRGRRGAVVRPGDQRVRLAGAAVGQPAEPHRGGLGARSSPTSRTATRPSAAAVGDAAAGSSRCS